MFKLPEDLESKYRFVTISALRAEQIQAGATPRLEVSSKKATVIAQQEVSRGLVEEWREEEEPVEGAETDADGEDDEEE